MMKKKTSSRIKYFPFYVISLIPMPILFFFSDILYVLVYGVFKYRRQVVNDNLKKSFPQKTPTEIRKIEKDFYRHFCDIMFESIKTLTINKRSIRKHLRIENPGLIEAYIKSRKNILLYTAHQGNWEWLIFLPLYFPCQANTFYKPLANRYFDGLVKLIRERFGVNCIESEKGYRTFIGLRQEDKPVINCIIGDQSPTGNATKHWCGFLNRETAFFTGAAKIAKKTDPVVLFPLFRKVGRGHYELQFQVISDSPSQRKSDEIVEQYAAKLENAVTESPELWLWSHRRWKLSS